VSLAAILGALSAPRRLPPVVRLRPQPWEIACYLARAVQGDACCDAIHRAGEHLLIATATTDGDEAIARAIALRDAAAELPAADRAPVVIAMLRDLLDDAPTWAAVALDRALVTAAALCRTTPTAEHRAHAARILLQNR
jgi:hypothetical protein